MIVINNQFTYIELFAGIGGFRQALDELGGRCVFASEIDKYAAQSYEAIYGDKPAGDITKIAADDIPEHDVLVGGFPCQAFSVAGQRKGFEDTRGTLFFEIARIAAAKKPKLLLLENVKGLLSHDGGNTFEVMCRTLNEIGYAIDFRVLNSKYFGVPQNRERIFIVADRMTQHEPWTDVKGNDVVTKAKRRAAEFGVRSFNFDWPAEGEVTVRLRDVLEPNVDEKYYLSEEKTNALLSLADEDKARMEFGSNNIGGFGVTSDGCSYCLTTRYDNGFLPSMFMRKERTIVVERAVVDERVSYRLRKMTPKECLLAQGFPRNMYERLVLAQVPDAFIYKQAGNAVSVPVIAAIGKPLIARLLRNKTKSEAVITIG